MQTTVTTGLARFKAVTLTQAFLLAAAAISSAVIWWQFAPRYFFQTAILDQHGSHVPWLLFHIMTGSLPLFTGPFLLWSGFRRLRPALHRKIGLAYLVGGGLGSAAGMALSIFAKHRTPAFYVSTFVLGVVWLTAALMAYRAIRNRQIEAHQEWMIRSYVLTWSFVGCRIPDLAVLQALGAGGDSTILWATWSVPLFFTEVALQWRRTGQSLRRT